jgi:hypothetical protein
MTISGDYVAGDKTIKYGPSKEEIEEAVKKALKENESDLRRKYGENYSVAAITPNGFVVPKGEVPSGFDVKWETGRVVNISSEGVEIVMPDMVVNTIHIHNMRIYGNKTYLPKKIGVKISPIGFYDVSFVIEVIGIDRDLVIVGLGMAPN